MLYMMSTENMIIVFTSTRVEYTVCAIKLGPYGNFFNITIGRKKIKIAHVKVLDLCQSYFKKIIFEQLNKNTEFDTYRQFKKAELYRSVNHHNIAIKGQ